MYMYKQLKRLEEEAKMTTTDLEDAILRSLDEKVALETGFEAQNAADRAVLEEKVKELEEQAKGINCDIKCSHYSQQLGANPAGDP